MSASDIDPTAASSLLISKPYRLQGNISIPPDFGPIGAVLLRVTWPGGNKHPDDAVYIESLDFEGLSQGFIPIHSYIYDQQGTRVFFSSEARLPKDCPPAIMPYRTSDLEVTQGKRTSIAQDGTDTPQAPFQPWHRVYQYDKYNDLGGDPKKAEYARPTLGGSALPYPRRLRTGRPLNPGTDTESSCKSGQPYLPRNETFSPIRKQGFNGNIFKNAALSALKVFGTVGRGTVEFDSFHDLRNWFSDAKANSMESSIGASAITEQRHQGFKWPAPRVYKGRPDMWRADYEFGRQTVAGQNPLTVEAVRSLQGTAFSSKTVPPVLTGGYKLEDLVAAGEDNPTKRRTLFQQNYSDIFVDYVDKVAKAHSNRVVYGARVLLYAEEGHLRPVAIELRAGSDAPAEVYTPLDGVGVWMLAKAFLTTNDAAVHQVVSHWLRTHASVEPFIISSRRCLSMAHPMNRLLQKHTVYTLQINSLARVALVNAGGIIERTFSPGRYSMELGSKVYGATWRFDRQALPEDLVTRGIAVPDSNSPAKVSLVQSIDYPFAEDALQLWTLLEGWIKDYVEIYYTDDAEVRTDEELKAWWDDIREEGHPDAKEGWPVLDGRAALTRIVTTIIWLASAHHAAVNFGQYDFSGLLLNRSSKIRKPFPARDAPEYRLLAAGADYEEIERTVLSYLAGPVDYATVLAVIEVLSSHDEKEAYLGGADAWVLDSRAVKRYERFAGDLKDLEADIVARNNNSNKVNRNGNYVMPYTLLMPTSKGGVTCRGVPNSTSI